MSRTTGPPPSRNSATAYGCPYHTLSRMIKRGTGANFTELLQRKRLSKAVQLLCDTSLSVNDIIAAVGYENNSYFHRVFRERYQLTPKEFQEKEQCRRPGTPVNTGFPGNPLKKYKFPNNY